MALKLILLSTLLLGIAITAIGIKMFVKKGGEFKKQCSTIDPLTGKPLGCTCGNPSESCLNNKSRADNFFAE